MKKSDIYFAGIFLSIVAVMVVFSFSILAFIIGETTTGLLGMVAFCIGAYTFMSLKKAYLEEIKGELNEKE